MTAKRVSELLLEYLQLAMSKAGTTAASDVQTESSYYTTLGGVCIEYCITVDRTDLLYGR